MVDIHQLSHQFSPDPLPLSIGGDSHSGNVPVRGSIEQSSCEANNTLVLNSNNRSTGPSEHSLESVGVLYPLLPTHFDQKLTNLIVVLGF